MRMRHVLPATAALVVALTACGDITDPSTAPSTPAPAPTTASATSDAQPPAARDPVAQRACDLMKQAIADGSSSDPNTMLVIGQTAGQSTTDQGMYLQGNLLAEYAKLAVAAEGASDEAAMKDSMMESALYFSAACVKGGYLVR